VHGVPYCVLECGIIVRYKWAMRFVGVNLRQCWHCCANLRSCLCDFSLSAEELSGTFEERCTAEWVQSTYTTSAWTCLVLLGYFCTLFPLSQKFHATCAYKFFIVYNIVVMLTQSVPLVLFWFGPSCTGH